MTLREELFLNQDLKNKDFMAKLCPNVDKNKIIGVKIPTLRKIAKRISKENIDFETDYFEEIMIKGFIIGYGKCDVVKRISDLRNFIPLIDNWAVCDSVCSTLKFAKDNLDVMWQFLMNYIDGSEYEVRFFVVMLMDYYFNDEYVDRVLDILKSINREEYYINMAVAWALSTAFVKYENKVMPIFEKRLLSPWVHNKAIQKTCESYRVDKETKNYIKTLKMQGK